VSDEEGRLIAAVAEDQTLTNRMLGLRAGTITQPEFLAAAPEHVRRLWDAMSKGPHRTRPSHALEFSFDIGPC
jgi:hypothetical protein